MNPTPGKGAIEENKTPEHFESDTQKIVRRHLQDKNHVITEDEIRGVRVGMTPPAEETDSDSRSDAETTARNDNPDPATAALTPWNNVEP